MALSGDYHVKWPKDSVQTAVTLIYWPKEENKRQSNVK